MTSCYRFCSGFLGWGKGNKPSFSSSLKSCQETLHWLLGVSPNHLIQCLSLCNLMVSL